MRYKRKCKKSKLIKAIENQFMQNRKEYFISFVVLIIGIIAGIILINSASDETKKSVYGYISEFVKSIKSSEYQIDGNKLLVKSIVSNIRIAIIIWIAGSSVIGIPIVYATLAYKGLCIGYSISAIIATLDKTKGIVFALSTMLLQNIIAIPCILAISVSSIKMYKNIMKNRNAGDIKFEIYRHAVFSAIMCFGLVISSFIEVFVSTNITSNLISNFI